MIVERCNLWNGFDKVCDLERCKTSLKLDKGCYHKPFKIDGKHCTVIEALKKIMVEIE